MPALALVFHLIVVADGTGREVSVGVEAATRAAAWCEYLETGDKVVAGTLIFTTSVAIEIEAVVYFLGP